jgi:hypothetical protein
MQDSSAQVAGIPPSVGLLHRRRRPASITITMRHWRQVSRPYAAVSPDIDQRWMAKRRRAYELSGCAERLGWVDISSAKVSGAVLGPFITEAMMTIGTRIEETGTLLRDAGALTL